MNGLFLDPAVTRGFQVMEPYPHLTIVTYTLWVLFILWIINIGVHYTGIDIDDASGIARVAESLDRAGGASFTVLCASGGWLPATPRRPRSAA